MPAPLTGGQYLIGRIADLELIIANLVDERNALAAENAILRAKLEPTPQPAPESPAEAPNQAG